MSLRSSQFTLAVDASWLREGGIARMAAEILARRPAHVRVLEMRAHGRNAGIFTPVDLALAARAAKADALWSPGFIPPLFRPAGKPVSITIHDLTHLHHYSRVHRLYYNVAVRPLLHNVDRIFTVSDFTRAEILSWTGLPGDRVVRIYNGVSSAFHPGATIPADRPCDRYVLYVGNRRSYKNIDRLIAAFARSSLPKQGYQLWLTGHDDGRNTALTSQMGVGDCIRHLGTLSDEDLANAYRQAHLTAFVSLYEGFGLPVAEAMACGCPVLTSSTTSLAEVAGDAALTVDPLSVEAISAGLDRLASDTILRARLRKAGLDRAAAFNWDASAAQYWSAMAPSA